MNHAVKEVTVRLSASKMDQKGDMVERCWGCICHGGLSKICPYCHVTSHLHWLQQEFVNINDNSPVFPTAEGGLCSKESVVETIEAMVKIEGGTLTTSGGERLYGGHSFRTGTVNTQRPRSGQRHSPAQTPCVYGSGCGPASGLTPKRARLAMSSGLSSPRTKSPPPLELAMESRSALLCSRARCSAARR